MKKMSSLILTLILLLGCVSLVNAEESVSQEVTLPTPVFDMSLEGSAPEGDSAQVLSVSNSADSGKAEGEKYVEQFNMEEGKKPVVKKSGDLIYLDFNSNSLTNPNQYLQVQFNAAKGASLANSDGMTIEMWIRRHEKTTIYYPIFSFGGGNGNKTSIFSADPNAIAPSPGYLNALSFYADKTGPNGDRCTLAINGTALPENELDEWIHILVTREWKNVSGTADTADETGQWRTCIYFNGELAAGNTFFPTTPQGRTICNPTTAEFISSRYNETDYAKYLVFGNSNGKTHPSSYDLADVRVYDAILGGEQAAKSYERDRALYMDVADVTPDTIEALKSLSLGRETDEFTIKFSNHELLVPETVINDNIYITDKKGNKVSTELSQAYNPSTGEVKFKLNGYLGYNSTYYLCLPNVRDLRGAIKREKIEFTTNAKQGFEVRSVMLGSNPITSETKIMEEAATISTEITNVSESEIKVGMMIGVYKDGKFERLCMTDTATSISVGQTKTVTLSTTEPGYALGEGYTIKSMVWNEVETEVGRNDYIAFTSPIELECE